jgi:hypothetical protein
MSDDQFRRAVHAVKKTMESYTADTSPEFSRRVVETAAHEFLTGPQCPCRKVGFDVEVRPAPSTITPLDAPPEPVWVPAPPGMSGPDGSVPRPEGAERSHDPDPHPFRDGAPSEAARADDALSVAARDRAAEMLADEAIAVLRALVDSLPKCTGVVDGDPTCARVATRAWQRGGTRYCDKHGPNVPEYPRAQPMRDALALLAKLDGKEAPTRETSSEDPLAAHQSARR